MIRRHYGKWFWCLLALTGLAAGERANAVPTIAWPAILAALCAIGLVAAVEALQGTAQGADRPPGEAGYRDLFEACPLPMWVYDLKTLEILAANEAAVAQYGYPRDQLLALRAVDLVEPGPVDKRAGGLPLETMQRHRKRDGSTFPVEASRREILFGRRKAALVLTRDCSAQLWSEKRAAAFSGLARRLTSARTPRDAARALLETADSLFQWDACTFDLCVDDRNEIRAVLYMDTVNGKRADISSHATGVAGPLTRQAMEKGPFLLLRPTPALEQHALPFGDKAKASASLMFAPIRQSNQVIGVLSIQSYRPNAYTQRDLAMLQDLADLCGATLERIRVESEMLQLNTELERRVKERTAQLEAINHELEAFSYSVSHDLRAPLRSIRGFSEVLLERYSGQLDERACEFLRRSCESSRHMDSLIEDLLKLSRVNRSQMKLQPIDLSALAQSVAADLRKTDPACAVEVEIAPNLRATGDERLIRIALDNLLGNAWKFTARQPRARIEFGREDGDEPAFFVRDNGAGFDMAYAGKLFGLFQRLHTVSEFQGTGIGLATVQRIINRHGGRTWAVGAVNQGATFYFTLPENPPCSP